MSPKSRNICIKITIHHHFHVLFKYQTLLLGNLEIPTHPLHIRLMWYSSATGNPVTLMNIKGDI